MRVYDLGCAQDHRFEGWFRSAEDYDAQRTRGLVECPLCGSHDVRRLLSAPKLGRARSVDADASTGDPSGSVATGRSGAEPKATGGSAAATTRDAPPPASLQALHAAWLRLARQVVAATENVGSRFADEARRIHYDEAPARPIRGTATAEQAAALADEGIDVMTLPLPAAIEEPLQ